MSNKTVNIFFFLSMFFLSANVANASEFNNFEQCFESTKNSTYSLSKSEAYDLWSKSEKIISAFKDKDSSLLIQYIDDFEGYVPSLHRFQTESFDSIFTAETVKEIVNSSPICRNFNWQGAMMASGQVWLDQREDKSFYIKTINGITEDPLIESYVFPKKADYLSFFYGKVFNERCLLRSWPSLDNYEELVDHYNIDVAAIRFDPSEYVSTKTSKPFYPSWVKDKENTNESQLAVAMPISQCFEDSGATDALQAKEYELLYEVDKSYCQKTLSDKSKYNYDLEVEKCAVFYIPNKELRSEPPFYKTYALLSNKTIAPVSFIGIKKQSLIAYLENVKEYQKLNRKINKSDHIIFDQFQDWFVSHVFDERTLTYKYSDAKTLLKMVDGRDVEFQITRRDNGDVSYKLQALLDKAIITVDGNQFVSKQRPLKPFYGNITDELLNSIAKTNKPIEINAILNGKSYKGKVSSSGSSAALRWIRAVN